MQNEQLKYVPPESVASRPQTAVVRSPWIVDPTFDLLFVCGGIPLVLVLINVMSYGWSAPESLKLRENPTPAILLGLVLVGQHLFANAHTIGTYLRIWGSEEDRGRFRFYRTWLVLIFVPFFIAGLCSDAITGAFVYFYLMAVFWHYAAQSYGIALIYCYKRNYFLSDAEKRILKLCVTSLSAYAILRFASIRANSPTEWYGVPLPFWGPLPSIVYHGAAIVFAGMMIAFSVMVLQKLVREGKIFPLPSLMLLLSVIALGLSERSTNAMLWFYVPAFFHGTQYLAVCLSYAVKESGETKQISLRTLFFSPLARRLFATTVVVGTFLYVAIPHVFQQFGFNYAVVSGLVLAVVNFHHFLTDAAIWRLRDPRCREILLG